MIEGKTKSGFEFCLDEEALDDYELLEMLCEVDKGKDSILIDAVKKLVGDEQEKQLREHVRNEKGRVSAAKMTAEIGEILASAKSGKNL